MPRERIAHGAFVGIGIHRKQLCQAHQNARSAEAALQGVMVPKRLLQRVKPFVICQALDRRNPAVICLHGQRQAAPRREAVQQDGACAADPVFAPEMRPFQAQLMTKEVAKCLPRIDLAPINLAVDDNGNVPRFVWIMVLEWWRHHRSTWYGEAEGLPTNDRLVFGLPGRQMRGVATRRPTTDEAFGQIAAGNIEMPENTAQLSCREQPGNGLTE
jgi:hypothetical protein